MFIGSYKLSVAAQAQCDYLQASVCIYAPYKFKSHFVRMFIFGALRLVSLLIYWTYLETAKMVGFQARTHAARTYHLERLCMSCGWSKVHEMKRGL